MTEYSSNLERDQDFIRDLVIAYDRNLLKLPILIIEMSAGTEFGVYSYITLPEYLSDKWGRDVPSPMALVGQGYFLALRDEEYTLTQKAWDLVSPNPLVSVFISYNRAVSSLLALALSNWLWRIGVENFLDIEGIDGGGLLEPHIKNAIDTRTHFICLLGQIKHKNGQVENTLDSEWVQNEIRYAHGQDKILVPFFQHNWVKPTNFDSILVDLLGSEGVPFVGEPKEYSSNHAKAYANALRDLLPFLNISRV